MELQLRKQKSVTVQVDVATTNPSSCRSGVSPRVQSKAHWIKSDQASEEPARAGTGLDFAERHLRGCNAGCSGPRDLKIGTRGYLVMVIEFFLFFSDPDHFK